MQRFVITVCAIGLAAGFAAACSGDTTEIFGAVGGGGAGSSSVTVASSSSGGGQGGMAQGGNGPGSSSSSGSSSSGSGMGGAGGAGAGQGGTGGALCPAGEIICNGNTKEVCDGMGGFIDMLDCAPGVCVPGLGCAQCVPGTANCNGTISQVCQPDGMGTIDYTCDPEQGVTCNPGTGLCEGECAPQVLGQSYVGCDYYPTVTANEVASTPFHFAVAVANTQPLAANIKVTRGTSMVATATVTANNVQIIELPWIDTLKTVAGYPTASVFVTDGAYRLRSDQPVTVYQYSPIEYQVSGSYSYTNDASLLLPVNAWTRNYRVMSRSAWTYSATMSWFPGFYAVTASQDNTTVVLSPSATGGNVVPGGGVAANGTGTVVMNEGDVLEVFVNHGAGNPDPNDLTGTLVTSNKPIQVISGHKCTFVPYDIGFCDHLEEAMLPTETLATEYIVTAPLIPTGGMTPNVEVVRIVATAANTILAYDPPQPGAPAMIPNPGDYVELAQTSADFKVTANAKILVAQYMIGGQTAGSGDPAMALAVATAQYRNDYLFHAPTNYQLNYVNITAPAGAVVTLDGQVVTGFSPIGTTGFSIARVALSNTGTGNHSITSSAKFGISVYGYGQFTSYWYPGGLDLTHL